MLSSKAVVARQGVTLALSQDANGVLANVILSRDNNLSQLFNGSALHGLRKAEQASLEHSFEGCYEVSFEDDVVAIRSTDLVDVLAEINRQASALHHKAGIRYGFNPSFAPEELAAIPAAQAHVSRLVKLRESLMQKTLLAS